MIRYHQFDVALLILMYFRVSEAHKDAFRSCLKILPALIDAAIIQNYAEKLVILH
jgi:hypothetical protein